MKRVIGLSLIAVSLIASQSVHIYEGWQLRGALAPIDTKVFDGKCVDFVWAYDGMAKRWQLYVANGGNYSPPASIGTLETIETGRGFWIKGHGKCDIKIEGVSGGDVDEKKLLDADPIPGILKEGFVFREVEVERHDDGIEIEVELHTLKADGTVDSKEYEYRDGKWMEEKDNENLHLTKEGWRKSGDIPKHYILDTDGTMTIDDRFKLAIVKEQNISGAYVLPVRDSDEKITLTLPAGSVAYFNRLERLKTEYELWDKKRTHGHIPNQEYYTNFAQFIEHQCGTAWFDGDHDGGVAFAGTPNGNGSYTCDGSATSGKLFEVRRTDNGAEIVNKDGGTWEIIEVYGQKIMHIHPANPDYREDDSEVRIYAEYDGWLWKGDKEPAGSKEIWRHYNQTAFDALKVAVQGWADARNDGSSQAGDHNGTTTNGGFTHTMLDGKSLYLVKWDDFGEDGGDRWRMAKISFTDHEMTWQEYNSTDTQPHTFPYEIDHFGRLFIEEEHMDAPITVETRTNTFLRVCWDGDCGTFLFFNEATAKAFRDAKNASIAEGLTDDMLRDNTWYAVWKQELREEKLFFGDKLTIGGSETLDWRVEEGKLVVHDPYTQHDIVFDFVEKRPDYLAFKTEIPGGDWRDETTWFEETYHTQVSEVGTVGALAKLFVKNGFRGGRMQANGTVVNPASSLVGRWWIEGDTLYFSWPDPDNGGHLDYKAYRIDNDRLIFQTDAPHKEYVRLYADKAKADAMHDGLVRLNRGEE